jgi:serine/threonine-protein kinase RsbW
VAASLTAAGYSNADQFGVRLALSEAITNGITHGNQRDPSKVVRVGWWATAVGVLLTVEDEGQGFDPALVPDPLHPDNLLRPSGRGLLLIRTYMTTVAYCRSRRRLALWKKRTASA